MFQVIADMIATATYRDAYAAIPSSGDRAGPDAARRARLQTEALEAQARALRTTEAERAAQAQALRDAAAARMAAKIRARARRQAQAQAQAQQQAPRAGGWSSLLFRRRLARLSLWGKAA